MGNMFNNYPQPNDYVPNNRPRKPRKFELNIMTGETSVHSFEIPFDVESMCKNVEVIYKCGLDIVLVKDFVPNNEYEDVSINKEEDCDFSIVTCTLNPEETMKFKNTDLFISTTYLDTEVQLRFVMKEDEQNHKHHEDDVIYSEIYKVTVTDSLNA